MTLTKYDIILATIIFPFAAGLRQVAGVCGTQFNHFLLRSSISAVDESAHHPFCPLAAVC